MTNKKNARSAFVTSVISLILCVSMLVGTTFAWFTDSVTSANNKIQAGNLKIDLELLDKESNTWTSLKESQAPIFDYDLWEPGYTDVKILKVENEGNLALKWFATFHSDAELSILANVIDVYVCPSEEELKYPEGRELTGYTKVGTVAEFINTMSSTTKGSLLPEDENGEDGIAYLGIALKMQESAGNEYQNLSLGGAFDIQILATQYTYEEDSFDEFYDEDAATYVAYDATKTPLENGNALIAAVAAANEGDAIVLGAGKYQLPKDGLSIEKDNLVLVGETGAEIEFAEAYTQGMIQVSGDDVVMLNLTLNKNRNGTNQVILAAGAENLTVQGCTFYGVNTGNVPTVGIYFYDNEAATGEKADKITKFTIENNTFLGASIGMYKGNSAETKPKDPGVKTAQVSADMVIADNTFDEANILIEGWRSWSKEANRDHDWIPTITGNNFLSPNLCFDNTPHSIYLRFYRQGDPVKIAPEGYIDEFLTNNTIEKPENDTVKEYNGKNYVLSDTYGMFYRDNATYGIIAYCYGQSYVELVSDAEGLEAALGSSGEVVLGTDIAMTDTATVPADAKVALDLNGHNITYTTPADANNATYHALIVKGNLTVSGNGTIALNDESGDAFNPSYQSTPISVSGGTLTLNEGVTVKASAGAEMAYAVDVNTTNGEAVLNVNGATLESSYIGVRIFNNHATAKGVVNYNSGIISGAKNGYDIWAQDLGKSAENAVVNIAAGIEYTTQALSGTIYYID